MVFIFYESKEPFGFMTTSAHSHKGDTVGVARRGWSTTDEGLGGGGGYFIGGGGLQQEKR
jgi:hypothetical protein